MALFKFEDSDRLSLNGFSLVCCFVVIEVLFGWRCSNLTQDIEVLDGAIDTEPMLWICLGFASINRFIAHT